MVLEEVARHRSHQGQGFIRSPMCPTPPPFCSAYGGSDQGVMVMNCWHQKSNCVLCIQSPIVIVLGIICH